MIDDERNLWVPQPEQVLSRVEYRDWNRSPAVIIRKTNELFKLCSGGMVGDPRPAKKYFKDYTFGFFDQAKQGSASLYDRLGTEKEGIDLEVREAADYAHVVFGHMHEMTTSPYLPMGFSRRGMLKAPEDRAAFLKRIDELKIGVWNFTEGLADSRVVFDGRPWILRTSSFFNVGSHIPMSLPDSEAVLAQLERNKFNDLLGGMNISLD